MAAAGHSRQVCKFPRLNAGGCRKVGDTLSTIDSGERINDRLGRFFSGDLPAWETPDSFIAMPAGPAPLRFQSEIQSQNLPARSDLPAGSDLLYERVGEAIALTDATIEQIRLLAQGLRPPALDTVGLNAAQEGFCHDFAQRTQLSVDYAGKELPPLPDAVGISLYRFLQEALTNVAKHADARRVRVELRQDAEAISLLVEDDGRGFDPEAVLQSQPTGIGLLGMQERFKLLGGWLEIASRPGQGTRLVAYVPWSESE